MRCPCALEMLGAAPLQEGRTGDGRPIWTFPPLDGKARTDAHDERGQGRPATPPRGIADLPGQGRGPAGEGSTLAGGDRRPGRPEIPPRGIADAPGRREDGRGADLSLASWTATLDTLRAPRKTGQKLADWRREAPIRPVVFEDAGVLSDDTVHLHLEQRVAQRLLARFRTQGFVHHDLSRACLMQAADSIPRVALLGRLCLFGRRAERLHEVLVPVAARWIEPSRRAGPLKAYAEEAEARTLERLEAALQNTRAPGETIHRRLLETAARDVEDLLPQLEARAEAVARSAADRLRERGEREERQLREILEGQRRRVEAELRRHEGGGVQLAIRVQRGREAPAPSRRRLLAHAPRLVRPRPGDGAGPHPGVLRSAGAAGGADRAGLSLAGHGVKGMIGGRRHSRGSGNPFVSARRVLHRRVEPIGLVYLWPDTG